MERRLDGVMAYNHHNLVMTRFDDAARGCMGRSRNICRRRSVAARAAQTSSGAAS